MVSWNLLLGQANPILLGGIIKKFSFVESAIADNFLGIVNIDWLDHSPNQNCLNQSASNFIFLNGLVFTMGFEIGVRLQVVNGGFESARVHLNFIYFVVAPVEPLFNLNEFICFLTQMDQEELFCQKSSEPQLCQLVRFQLLFFLRLHCFWLLLWLLFQRGWWLWLFKRSLLW